MEKTGDPRGTKSVEPARYHRTIRSCTADREESPTSKSRIGALAKRQEVMV